jgi:hypothetical protein
MAAVTQRITSYLGGVSKQSDDKKLPGQVRECYNGYPDPTFGLTKRPGFKHIVNIGTGTTYDDGKWFYINRDDDEEYIGVIKGTSINIWNAISGATCTVTYPDGTGYLTGSRDNYKLITIQDTTIVINDSVTVGTQTAPANTNNTSAIVVLDSLEPDFEYSITLQGEAATAIPQSSTTFDDMLDDAGSVNTNHHLRDALDDLISTQQAASNADFAGTWTLTANKDSLIIERVDTNGDPASFTIEARGGVNNDSLYVFQEQVANVARLPNESKNGTVIKIVNTSSNLDDYYVKFIADDGTSGRGYWEETVAPNVSNGLNNSTMPHEIVNTAVDTFLFREIDYEDRLVGDNQTNEDPSFVGEKISGGFFHNNRLGFISKDNVSMSQAGDFYNFYHASAQTVIDSDPIDISCSSIRPTSLHAVVPTAQGVVLFSEDQQFILFSDTGVLTPALTTIRTLSNYELDRNIDPVEDGTTINFITKTPGYSRVFGMTTRGQQENPQVLDISRVVKEWISPDVDSLISSPQNSLIALSGQSLNEVFLFAYYNNGKENVMQSWFSWLMPGTVQFLATNSDDMYAVTKQDDQFVISKAVLSQAPEQGIIVNSQGEKVNPCVDMYATASSVVYDSATKTSKCYLPYNDVTTLDPIIVIKGSTAGGSFVESGFNVTPERGSDGTGDFFSITGKDLTSVASDVIVGFRYDFDVELPRIYYRPGQVDADFTANLTISRMKFAVGLSGVMGFKLKANGRAEWYDVQPVIEANTYLANDVPLDAENVFTLPIHQRTENFRVRMFNDSPFPVAVNAMMWEGKYTPRFYRRV